jgi:hypothetical protein
MGVFMIMIERALKQKKMVEKEIRGEERRRAHHDRMGEVK